MNRSRNQTSERLLVDAMSDLDDEALEVVAMNVDMQARVPGMEYKNAAYYAAELDLPDLERSEGQPRVPVQCP